MKSKAGGTWYLGFKSHLVNWWLRGTGLQLGSPNAPSRYLQWGSYPNAAFFASRLSRLKASVASYLLCGV